MTVEPAVEVEGLRLVRGGRAVLEAPDLALRRGEVLAVVGPNGAGKSSLLGAMALLLRPAAGLVRHFGRRADDLRGRALLEARRRLGCVFQEPLLLDRSVAWNVELGLALRGAKRSDRRAAARRAMARLGIEALACRRASALSGGEARRATIARALAISPEVLFLDEPFSALDEPTRRALVSDAGELLAGSDRATVLVTHDRGEALALADRAALLLGGRLVQVGPVSEVMGRPATEAAAAFLGYDNAIEGEVLGRSETGALRVRLPGGAVVAATAALEGDPPRRVSLRLRPEDLALEPAPAGGEPGVGLVGRVARVTPEGFACRVAVETELPVVVVLSTSRDVERAGIRRGVAVMVRPPGAEALLAYW